MESTIQVMAADRSEIFMQGLSVLFSEHRDVELMEKSRPNGNLVDLVEERKPDILLIGSNNSAEIIADLRARDVDTRCIVLVDYDNGDSDVIFENLRAGAHGYMLRTVRPEEMVQGIKSVYGGGTLMSKQYATRVLRRFNELADSRKQGLHTVSSREREIVDFMARGLSNKQIAYELGISTKTVKTHVAHIMKKLEAKNRTEAVVIAVRMNLIDIQHGDSA
jgi:DNA-binding NarL/FixJ family response regulator